MYVFYYPCQWLHVFRLATHTIWFEARFEPVSTPKQGKVCQYVFNQMKWIIIYKVKYQYLRTYIDRMLLCEILGYFSIDFFLFYKSQRGYCTDLSQVRASQVLQVRRCPMEDPQQPMRASGPGNVTERTLHSFTVTSCNPWLVIHL